jgi:hypothetical protein
MVYTIAPRGIHNVYLAEQAFTHLYYFLWSFQTRVIFMIEEINNYYVSNGTTN